MQKYAKTLRNAFTIFSYPQQTQVCSHQDHKLQILSFKTGTMFPIAAFIYFVQHQVQDPLKFHGLLPTKNHQDLKNIQNNHPKKRFGQV